MDIILTWKGNEALAIKKLWSNGVIEKDNPKIGVCMTGYRFTDTSEVREVMKELGLKKEDLYAEFRKEDIRYVV